MRTILCCAVLLVSAQLSAYELIGAKFQSTVITWHLGKAPARVRKAVEQAFRDWSEVSPLVFVEVSSGANLNIFFDKQGGPVNDVLATSITRLHDERIIDSDIIINARDYRWFGRKSYDLRSVLCHEIGHALGLEHNENPSSLMYATFVPGEVRAFTEDDILGIIALYGNIKASKEEVALALTF